MRDLALTAEQLFHDLSCQHRDAKAPPLDVALGFYEVHQNRLFNSGLYATLGGPDAGIRHVHRKVFLPTYGVFDEERFVEAGRSRAGVRYPLGPRRAPDLRGCLALLHPDARRAGRGAAHHHSRARARPAASVGAEDAPGRPASLSRWSGSCRTWRASTACTWRSHSWWGSREARRFRAGAWWRGRAATCWPKARCSRRPWFTATLDFEEITRARADLPLLADLEMRLPHLLGSLHDARRGGKPGGSGRSARRRQGHRRRWRPRLPALAPAAMRANPARDPLAIDPELTRRWLVEFIRDEVQRRRGFERVVIGLSGGVDSSLVAYLAAEALGAGQRDRRPHAVPDLEPGKPGPRAAGGGRARHPRDDRGHQRGRGWSRGGAARAADARPPGQHHGPRPHDHAVRPLAQPSGRCRWAPATRPSDCSATSPGTRTTRRR